MRFDGEGRVVWTPREFFDLVSVDPRRTIDNLLTVTDFGGGAGIIVSHAVARSRCLCWNSLQGNKLNAPIFRQPTTVQ
jgi:hypothetical protein